MHAFEIAPKMLENYKNDWLSDERIEFLKAQANEQIEEISQNKELYDSFLERVKAPEKIDNIILWMLFMSDEKIVEEYIDAFDKDFFEMIPVCDLADLLLYIVHLKKVEGITLDGVDYLIEYQHPGKDEFDHNCVTNVLNYISKSKETELQF